MLYYITLITNDQYLAVNNCLEIASCENTLGSYKCVCPPGYVGDGINECHDRKECADGCPD